MGCNSECHVFPVTAFKSPIWKDFGAEWCGFSRWYTKEYFLWLINMLKNSNWNVWFTKTYVYIYNYMCLFVFFYNIYWFTNNNIYVYIYIYVYYMHIYIIYTLTSWVYTGCLAPISQLGWLLSQFAGHWNLIMIN